VRKLRTTEICGTRYTEYVSKPTEHDDLPGAVAITCHKTARILYNSEHYDKKTHAAIRLHELFHIALYQTGLTVRFKRELKPAIDTDDFEEDVVAGLTVAFAPLFAKRLPR
jgi:hypothetical protein